MNKCEATVIVPTTGNRGDLLRFSIASIQTQTLQDYEILIVGDGVSDEAKSVIADLRKEDPRIVFHDFRRGKEDSPKPAGIRELHTDQGVWCAAVRQLLQSVDNAFNILAGFFPGE